MSLVYLNTPQFTQSRGIENGSASGAEFPRLADLIIDQTAPVDFVVRGEQTRRVDGGIEQYLGLTVTGFARMRCLRCLLPVDIPVNIDRQFRLAKDESEASVLDEEDDLIDAIVGGPRLALFELIEDELIMALPYSPKHDNCGLPAAAKAPEKPNPFAVLGQLKKPNP